MRASSYEEVHDSRYHPVEIAQLERMVAEALRRDPPRAIKTRKRHWEIHYQMNCLKPVSVFMVGRPGAHFSKKQKEATTVTALYRCRHCEGCLESKARLWGAYCCAEYRAWPRSFMGTFTLSPMHHSMLDVRVARKEPIGQLTPDELFQRRAREFGYEIAKWAKRVREAAFVRTGLRGTMRYMLVAERHDSAKTADWMRGRPHFHCLVHETTAGALIKGDPLQALKDLSFNGEYLGKEWNDDGVMRQGTFITDESSLRQQWKLGWTTFQVCFSEKAAFYVCKYMAMDGPYRVVASEHYGEPEVSPHYKQPVLLESLIGSESVGRPSGTEEIIKKETLDG